MASADKNVDCEMEKKQEQQGRGRYSQPFEGCEVGRREKRSRL